MKQVPHLECIAQGIKHIAKTQETDGSFLSVSSTRKDFSAPVTTHRTTFFASQILMLLPSADEMTSIGIADPALLRTLNTIRRKASAFLMKEKSVQWSFNYWSRKSWETKKMPYPDDLDDTFSGLIALHRYDAKLIDAKALAAMVRMLTAVEIGEGGPYRTWLAGPGASAEWRDVDLVVNSAIGRFLSLYGIRLPNLEKFILSATRAGQLKSPYYPGLCQVAYFVSAFSEVSAREEIIKAVLDLQHHDGTWNDPLETAIAIVTLQNSYVKNFNFTKSTNFLINTVARDGWQFFAFCIDPARDGKVCYAGSSALTAAFIIRALLSTSSGRLLMKKEVKVRPSQLRLSEQARVHTRIKALAKKRAQILPVALRKTVIEILERTRGAHITGLIYQFREALGPVGKNIPLGTLESLSLGNLYGWMAYTIYDDFLDDEGEPLYLSTANYFLRELTFIFTGSNIGIAPSDLKELFSELLNTLDEANVREQRRCRLSSENGILKLPHTLPLFGEKELADRSIGHALGPLTVLGLVGYSSDSFEGRTLLEFFRYYLAARQMHDDAHDWAEDLSRGRLNSVGRMVLMRRRKRGDWDRLDLATELPALKKLFWQEVVSVAARRILHYTSLSRSALQKLQILPNPLSFYEMIEKLESSARRSAVESKQTQAFLDNYE